MIRTSLFIALFFSVTSLFAQDSNSVFLDKATVNWFQDVVLEYNQALKTLESSEKKERMASFRTMNKIVEQLSKNSPIICTKMEQFLDPERIERLSVIELSDGAERNQLEQNNSIFRRSDNFTEVEMTKADYQTFKENVDKIIALEDEISSQDYINAANITNGKLASSDNLMVISNAANANRDLLISRTVEK